MDNTTLESSVLRLQSDVSELKSDMKDIYRKVPRLLYLVEGEDGRGGITKTVTEIAAQQKLALFFPTLISFVSLIISLIALSNK